MSSLKFQSPLKHPHTQFFLIPFALAGQSGHVNVWQLRIQRIFQLQRFPRTPLPPSQVMWDLKCTPGSIVQIPEPGRGIHITSGCDNQHGFCMSGRETGTSVRNYLFLSLLKTQALILTEGGQIRAKWSL